MSFGQVQPVPLACVIYEQVASGAVGGLPTPEGYSAWLKCSENWADLDSALET